jgi:hypothetical protein
MRSPGGSDSNLGLVKRLLRPVRNLQALVWLSTQAAAGESRARATLSDTADELSRDESRCSKASLAASSHPQSGAGVVPAAVLDVPALVAAAWHMTYLFADAPQRRQVLLDALLREAAATYPLALMTAATGPDIPTRTMMLMLGDDLGFDPGGWEPGPLDPDLDLDPIDPDSILDLIGTRHRPPPLVWTDTGFVVDKPGSTFDRDRVYPALRCLRDAARLLELHATPPPPQLTPATWFTGITKLETDGPCAGDTLSIHGSGFGAVQPPGVVLLLPRADGWVPVAVSAADWSDTLIKVTLPIRVVSGPVGFGDAAYLAVYNGWVDQLNAIADELAQLPCAPQPGLPKLPRWLPPPVGPVNILAAGEAYLEMFTANGGINIVPDFAPNVLTPGTPLRLDWKVTNAVTLQVKRIGADGPPVNITDPTETFADLGPVAHTQPSEFTYRLSARGPCGKRKSVTISVYASQRPQLKVAGTSVEQGWSQPAGIRLVAGKPTLVRVRVRHGLNGWGSNSVPGVTGKLWLTNKWTGTTDFVHPAVYAAGVAPMTETVGASIKVRDYPDWAKVRHTLNFLMPGQLTTPAERSAAVHVSVSGFGAVGTFPGYSQTLVAPVPLPTFHPRRPLDIRYIPVQWGATPAPSDAECVELIQQAMTFLPTPWANIAPLWPGKVYAKESNPLNNIWPWNVDGNDFDDLLDLFELLHHGDALWVLVVPFGVGPLKLDGQAAEIPSKVLVTRLHHDTAAHELAHCLNQHHIRKCGARGGDSASEWDGGNFTGVIVDWRRSETFISPWDLMTYCDPEWPVPRRWNELFDWIGP